MGIINGLSTVNEGIIQEFTNNKYNYLVELMGCGYTSHPDNVVATYFMDEYLKTCLMLWAGKKKEAKFCVYKYKTGSPTQHYYARVHTIDKLPPKYVRYARELLRAYSLAFNSNRMAFNYPANWGLV